MTNGEKFTLLSGTYLRNRDIADILECSKAKATQVMKDIKKEITESGFKPFERCVSTKSFLKHTGMNLKEIHGYAMLEAKLKNATKGVD